MAEFRRVILVIVGTMIVAAGLYEVGFQVARTRDRAQIDRLAEVMDGCHYPDTASFAGCIVMKYTAGDK